MAMLEKGKKESDDKKDDKDKKLKLPSDFAIFSLLMVSSPLWIQYRANFLPAPSDWAISFSWCGNIRSTPPP